MQYVTQLPTFPLHTFLAHGSWLGVVILLVLLKELLTAEVGGRADKLLVLGRLSSECPAQLPASLILLELRTPGFLPSVMELPWALLLPSLGLLDLDEVVGMVDGGFAFLAEVEVWAFGALVSDASERTGVAPITSYSMVYHSRYDSLVRLPFEGQLDLVHYTGHELFDLISNSFVEFMFENIHPR